MPFLAGYGKVQQAESYNDKDDRQRHDDWVVLGNAHCSSAGGGSSR